MNLEQQIFGAAEAGSESSIGAHIMSKTTRGLGDKKILPKLVKQEIRGGRGSTGDPAEIKAAIEKAQKLENHADHLLAKLKNDKEGLLFILADLKIKQGELIKSGRERKEGIGIRHAIERADAELATINGNLPERSQTEDQKKLEDIIQKWNAGVRDWKKEIAQAKEAEKLLRKNPNDGHIAGNANRARTERVATEAELEKIATEANQVLTKNELPSPAEVEGVSYTHTQAVADRKDWEERHKKAQADAALEAVPDAPMEPLASGEDFNTAPVVENEVQKEPNLTSNIPQATANDWQDEAIKNFELSRNSLEDKVSMLDESTAPEAESVPETEAEIPTLTEIVDTPTDDTMQVSNEILPKNENEGEVKETNMVREEFGPSGERIYKKFELSAEVMKALDPVQLELFEKIQPQISSAENEVAERAKKAEIKEGWVSRKISAWDSIPLRYKIILTVGMTASGMGAAFVGATTTAGAIAAIGAGLRGVAGGSMAYMFEGFLKDRAEKNGGPRSGFAEIRDSAIAASLSIIVVGVLPGVIRDWAVDHGVFQKIHEFFPAKPTVEAAGFSDATLAAEVKLGQDNLAAPDTNQVDSSIIAEAGDSRWTLAERALSTGPHADQFNAIESAEQRTYIIDALKDKITEGMSPEQANALAVGDEMNFKEVFENKDFMSHTFSGAENLSPSDLENISSYEPAAEMSPTINSNIPAEILPGNDAALAELGAQANKVLSTDMDTLFGDSRFLWFGHINGLDSIHWNDPKVGFGNKTIGEIMNAHPSGFPGSSERTFGIEDPTATKKMQDYIINNVGGGTGLTPNPNESVAKFVERAVIKSASLPK